MATGSDRDGHQVRLTELTISATAFTQTAVEENFFFQTKGGIFTLSELKNFLKLPDDRKWSEICHKSAICTRGSICILLWPIHNQKTGVAL
ncbi:hypothetical protein GJAV_G00254340 [Gymnothorax javanicus]|nr:hypothetical protein GJAV_G00254340 [Gymnothorax javanicus]